MKLHTLKHKLSIVVASAILTLTSATLPVFAATTNEASLNSVGAKVKTENTLITQRYEGGERRENGYGNRRGERRENGYGYGHSYETVRCHRIHHGRERCYLYRCRRRGRCYVIRTWIRRVSFNDWEG